MNLQDVIPNGRNVWSLFDLVSEASVGGIKRFIIADFFRDGEVDGVSIASIGPSFQERYQKEIERNVKPATLSVLQLKKMSFDYPIGQEFAVADEPALFHLLEMLQRQGSGEEGSLSLNHPNLIYKNDGVILANWRPSSGGWFIGRNSIEDQIARRPGVRILSLRSFPSA